MDSVHKIIVAIVCLFLCPAGSTGSITADASATAIPVAIPATAPGHPGPNLQQAQLNKGIFLVASKNLTDPNFGQTVIFLIDYNESGTVGLIINRWTHLPVSEVFPDLDNLKYRQDKVRLGGPVAINRFQILFQSDTVPAGANQITMNIFQVSSISLLEQIRSGVFQPDAMNVYAGYAGWAAGQLESELLRGDWYLWQADPESVFSRPVQEIWPDLIRKVTAQWVSNQRQPFLYTTLYN